MTASRPPEANILGRYAIYSALGTAGTGTVHFARLIGPVGFLQTVAVKRLRGQVADDPDAIDAFVKEVKLAASVRHENLVVTSDVVAVDDEVLLAMDYVPSESLARLFATAAAGDKAIAPPLASAIVGDVLRGLHAAHEAKDDSDQPLSLVHGAVAPGTILVGSDGIARVTHLGLVKALRSVRREGTLDAHLAPAYAAPETLGGASPTRATDVYAAGVVLWELLTGKRLFAGDDEAEVIGRIRTGAIEPPSVKPLDELVLRATATDPEKRFATALEMAHALEALVPAASRADITAFVEANAGEALSLRAKTREAVEAHVLRPQGVPSTHSVRSVSGPAGARVVFGLVLPETASVLAPRVDELCEWMGDEVGIEVVRRNATSYEALAMNVREGKVDVAWLPPIVYVRLIEGVTPLGSILRGANTTYEASLVVRADTKRRTIDSLRGTRAGWVDPWSAAGFVLPRINLSLMGVDPRALFRTEKFYGSHRAAIEALVEGACDVVGTYARADDKGEVVAGSWSEVEGADIRVIATFGAIPPDVIAVRRNLLPATHEKILEALRAATKDAPARALLRAVFGGEELNEELEKGYESLRGALDGAITRGLFD